MAQFLQFLEDKFGNLPADLAYGRKRWPAPDNMTAKQAAEMRAKRFGHLI